MRDWARRFFTVTLTCALLGAGCGGGGDDDDDDDYRDYYNDQYQGSGGSAAAPTGGYAAQSTATGGTAASAQPTGGATAVATGGNIYIATGGVEQIAYDACPSSPQPDATCLNIGQECNYGSQVCTCTVTGYSCTGGGVGGSSGNVALCPASAPRAGSTCEFEQMGIQCTYGGMTCTCYFPQTTLYWVCE
jgi:hypothetical protein